MVYILNLKVTKTSQQFGRQLTKPVQCKVMKTNFFFKRTFFVGVTMFKHLYSDSPLIKAEDVDSHRGAESERF